MSDPVCQQQGLCGVIIGAKWPKTFMSYALWVSNKKPLEQLFLILQVE